MYTTREFALWLGCGCGWQLPSPITKSSSSEEEEEEELRLRHSVHCKQRHGIQTCPTPFLSCLLSCLLACKPPPPTTITLDDVSSQQKT